MDTLEFAIERKILHIGNSLIARRNRDLKRFGLTSSQSETLLYVESHQGTSIVALKNHLNVSHQAVQKTVGLLHKRGLVRLEVSADDARVKCVSLSSEGGRLCAALKEAGALSGHSMLERLDEDQREALWNLLSQIEDV